MNIKNNSFAHEDMELLSILTNKINELTLGRHRFVNQPVILRRNYSFLLRYSCHTQDGKGLNLLVKIPRKPWMRSLSQAVGDDSLRLESFREFNVLNSIALAIKSSNVANFCAIDVLAYLNDFGAIVMEELPLRPLKTFYVDKRIVMNSTIQWKKFEDCLNLSGELLRIIHTKLGNETQMSLSETGIKPLVDVEFSHLETLTVPQKQLRRRFADLYSIIEEYDTCVVTLHKDYHLGNIFLDQKGRVGILDPNWQARGSIYEDLARLIIDPLTRVPQILSQGIYFRSLFADRFEHAVLKGYFGVNELNSRILSYYCAFMALTMWRVKEESLKNRTWRFPFIFAVGYKLLIRRYFSRLVDAYLIRGLRWSVS